MECKRPFIFKWAWQTVICLFISPTIFGSLKTESSVAPPAKSFAVFVARYNSQTHEARGGVAGTAFFISSTRAVTAYHVLQASSFKRTSRDEQVRIWLVRENRPAIEVHTSNLAERKSADMTLIDFKQLAVARQDEVYRVSHAPFTGFGASKELPFETDGFLANSVGPLLIISFHCGHHTT